MSIVGIKLCEQDGSIEIDSCFLTNSFGLGHICIITIIIAIIIAGIIILPSH